MDRYSLLAKNHYFKLLMALTGLLVLVVMATPTLAVDPTPGAAPQFGRAPNTEAQQTPPGTPQIDTVVNLGVPPGNGASPKHLALNPPARELYILSEGVPILKEGSGLSVYNIETGQITAHIKINRGDNETLDLQADPQAGLIYALWKERFTESRPVLTVIQSQSLQPTQEIPEVEAFAAAGGTLYAANAEELLAVNLANNSLAQAQKVQLPLASVTGPMAIDPAANRLYLARSSGGSWRLEIFEADTLTPLTSYPADGPVLNILPQPTAGQLLLVVRSDNFRVLYRLTADGDLADLPYELGERTVGANGIALTPDETTLYFSNGDLTPLQPDPTGQTGPALVGLSAGSLSPQTRIPLMTNVDKLVIDGETGQAFALYPFEDYLYVIDLTNETVEITNTAIDIRDVLVDVQANYIYVSDSANRVRRLDGDTLELLAQTTLTGNKKDYGFKLATWSGQLALDRQRNRLYVSGLPATVLALDTLTPLETLEPGGQIVANPAGNSLYISNCGLTVLNADTLASGNPVPGSTPRPDGMIPNPCVEYSQLDPDNGLLYSLAPNGVPGSNSGNLLYVYDLAGQPTQVFTDSNISFGWTEPDPVNRQAYVTQNRHGNKRIRILSPSAPISYTRQLMGASGGMRYSPATNRLYVADSDYGRLLTLQAGTLAVIDELFLPANYRYRLAALDPLADRLFFVGLDGQFLVTTLANRQPKEAPVTASTQKPTGTVFQLERAGSDRLLARIQSDHDGQYGTRLYASSNQGQSWSDLSQNMAPFPLSSLAVAQNNGDSLTLFAALLTPGQTGGLYKSTDGGQRWVPAMAGLQDLWVETLYISPNFTQTGLIFAKTTYAGLHQSTDGGQSWTPLAPLDPNASLPSSVQHGAVAFGQNGVVLASQNLASMTGIYRATLRPTGTLSDWEPLLDMSAGQLALGPDGRTVLAFGNEGLWRSPDGGQSWQAGGAGLTGIADLQPAGFLFSPAFRQDQTVYLFFKDISGSAPAILFRSTDGGQRWQPWLDPVSGGNRFTAVTLSARGDFLFGNATTQLARFSPTQLDWQDAQAGESPILFSDLAASPSYESDQTLFAISMQHGLFKSKNGGQTWQLTDFLARGQSSLYPNRYQLALSPNFGQDQTLYVATGRSLHRSTDGGERWEQLRLKIGSQPPSASFQAQKLALSPNFGRDQTLLVSSGAAIYRSTDGGDRWEVVLSLPVPISNSDLLAIAPDGETAYARFGYGSNLFVSRNGGQSWQEQPATIDEYFSLIGTATAPNGTLTAAVEYNTRLLKIDPQTSTWQPVNETMPQMLNSADAVAYSPDNTLFVGGQGGVFRSVDDGQSWQSLNDTLPADVRVTNLLATNRSLIATTAAGQIFSSTDSGVAWTDISIGQ